MQISGTASDCFFAPNHLKSKTGFPVNDSQGATVHQYPVAESNCLAEIRSLST